MDIGMLWFDNDTAHDLSARVLRAASYYRAKYGQIPNKCFVHPSMIPANGKTKDEAKTMAGKIEVCTAQTILPNHFWIGVASKN